MLSSLLALVQGAQLEGFAQQQTEEVGQTFGVTAEVATVLIDLLAILGRFAGEGHYAEMSACAQCVRDFFAMARPHEEPPVPSTCLEFIDLMDGKPFRLLSLWVAGGVGAGLVSQISEHWSCLVTSLALGHTPAAQDRALRVLAAVRAETEEVLNALVGQPSADASEWRRILCVSADCTEEELRAAHRKLVREWHPDKLNGMAEELQGLANDRLAEINGAFQNLLPTVRGASATQDSVSVPDFVSRSLGTTEGAASGSAQSHPSEETVDCKPIQDEAQSKAPRTDSGSSSGRSALMWALCGLLAAVGLAWLLIAVTRSPEMPASTGVTSSPVSPGQDQGHGKKVVRRQRKAKKTQSRQQQTAVVADTTSGP